LDYFHKDREREDDFIVFENWSDGSEQHVRKQFKNVIKKHFIIENSEANTKENTVKK
jgi:quinol monooxygenase YgiN